MLTFRQLQIESQAWVKRNFGDRPMHQPLLGLGEEYGELVGAEKLADIKDAVADIVIFLTDFCNSCNIDMEFLRIDNQVYAYTVTIAKLERDMAKEIGKINHHYLKREQGIRGTATYHENEIATHVQNLLSILKVYSKLAGFDFMQNVEDTWMQVRKRDWAASRTQAGALPAKQVDSDAIKPLQSLDEHSAYSEYK